MDNKTLHRIFGFLSFMLGLVVYSMTVQPTVPFWDCGEFSAASVWQQVPHPPGAPLFLMIGKLFHTLIPFGDPGWRVNMAAVVSSAFTIMLLYLITVKVIENFHKKSGDNFWESIAIYGSGFIAAAAFTFSDTNWFNSVESEVYATSTTFVAVIVYLMMKWNENSEKAGNERYLLLIAYLMGLSTGVHLLSILTIFSIVLVVYFKRHEVNFKTVMIMGMIAVGMFVVTYPLIIKWIPAFLAGHTAGKNAAMEYSIENSMALKLVVVGVILAAIYGLYTGYKKQMQILTLACASFLFVLLGYTTYTQILIRSHSNSPMNENEPKTFSKLSSYLGREQYGDAPNWPRRYQTEDYFIQRYNLKDEAGNYVYGEWTPPTQVPVTRKDGSQIGKNEFQNVNSAAEFSYMWNYQMVHMYFRYFGWNFIGRNSDAQDAGVAKFDIDPEVRKLNYDSGYASYFPVRFFALPFLFGMLGLLFHFWRDPKIALSYIVMFLLMGILATLQQNQQDPQPRERDYFYAGSFFVWCLWIGMGAFALIDYIATRAKQAKNEEDESLESTPNTYGVALVAPILIVVFALAPLNMALGGWKIHSRAGNYIPFDYSYNILQSVEQDAIMFTNGDNDTFPLWWLQDVAGVRRDVRIVNLSLGNTLWYIDQLKNRSPWGAKKIPLSFADDSIQIEDEASPLALSYDFGEPKNLIIPVKRDILARFTNDPETLNSGVVKMVLQGKPYQQTEGKNIQLFRVQDKLIQNILEQVRWERPIYFANTVGPDAFCGLESYFRYEGMAIRVCPVPQKRADIEQMDTKVMEACLMNIDNSDNYSKTQKFGFKMRNLNNMNVYYDEVARRLMSTYRSLYISYAAYTLKVDNNPTKSVQILNKLNELISTTQFPMSMDMSYKIAKIYTDAGDKAKAKEFISMGLRLCNDLIKEPKLNPEYVQYEMITRFSGPFRISSNLYELEGNFAEAKNTLIKLKANVEAVLQGAMGTLGAEDMQSVQYNYYDLLANINELEINEVEKSQGTKQAIAKAKELFVKFANSQKTEDQYQAQYLMRKMEELQKKSGDTMTTAQLLESVNK